MSDGKKPTPKPSPPVDNPPGFGNLQGQLAQFAGLVTTATADSKLVWVGGKDKTKTVKQMTDAFVSSMFDASDPNHIKTAAIFQSLYATGAFGKSPDKQTVHNSMRRIFIDAADVYNASKGRKIDWMQNYLNNMSVVSRYTQSSTTPATTQNITSYTDEQATNLGKKVFAEVLGRAPSAKELSTFKSHLISAAAAAPQITTVSGTGAKKKVVQKGGFDQNSWVASYMSGLLPQEKKKADLSGAAGTWQDKVRETLNDYGLTAEPMSVLNDVRDLLNGKLTEEALVQRIQGQAKGKFGPAMATAIDAGNTVRQVVQPFMAQYADLMEVNANSVDVGDVAAMASVGEGNQQRLLTQNEFTTKVRQMSDWSKTTNAKNEAYDLGQSVLKMFGLVK